MMSNSSCSPCAKVPVTDASVLVIEDADGSSLTIEATAQTSRFCETNMTTIDLHDVTITVGESDPKELLSHADLRLTAGLKYALIGPNGCGKSILLKVLASGMLFDPDVQLSLRMQLVAQSFSDPPPGWTVADEVNVRPFGCDVLQDAKNVARRAARRAELRSGKRGKEAREAAVALLSAAATGLPPVSKHSTASVAPSAVGEKLSSRTVFCSETEASGKTAPAVSSSFSTAAAAASVEEEDEDVVEGDADLDEPPSEADIARAFAIMGVPLSMLSQSFKSLSGGWRMRITLAKALIYEPNFLLLDEPTNHLDIGGINRLRKLLKSDHFSFTTIIFVSHDLFFVNDVAEAVIHLSDRALSVSKGNWETLKRERGDKKKFTDRYAADQEKETSRLLASIEDSMRKAGKDDKLRKQLASRREKVLERGTGMMRNSKGHRYFKNADENAGYFNTLLREVEVVTEEKPVRFRFEHGITRGSSTAPLLSVDALEFSYPPLKEGGGSNSSSGGSSSSTSSGSKSGSALGSMSSVSASLPPSKVGASNSLKGGSASPASTKLASGASSSKAKSSGGASSSAVKASAGGKVVATSSSSSSSSPAAFSVQLKDLNVMHGERLVLLGPNGHGKSTLLKLLVGELTPAPSYSTATTAGTVQMTPLCGYFEQHSVERLGAVKTSALDFVIHTIGKEGGGEGYASSFSAVASGGGGGHASSEDRARKVLGSFGLGPHASTPVKQLSGGQRVALAFALISMRHPALLLLDEPSAHLSLEAREGLATALAEYGGAIVFISHDIGFIELVKPTRSLLCRNGRFVAKEDWKSVALALDSD